MFGAADRVRVTARHPPQPTAPWTRCVILPAAGRVSVPGAAEHTATAVDHLVYARHGVTTRGKEPL
jgi:hypothetical protein